MSKMKKLFLSLVALMAATMSFAQNTLVVTLSHGEDVTMYYGTYALRNAMNAAVSGDIINLSGGAFQAVDITKAVTLRGTGIDDAAPSYISGNFTINVPADDVNRLSMEGIRCTGTITMSGTFNSPYFVKSAFSAFSYNDNSTIKNAMFADCRISGSYKLRGTSTVQFINSYVKSFSNSNSTNTAASFINCVILPNGDGYYALYLCNSQLINCIIYQAYYNGNMGYNYSSYSMLPSSTIATNCVAVGYSNFFSNQTASTGNKHLGYNEYGKLFKSFTGSYSEAEQFELTDEAKTTYLGTDGTEVGMHGGVLPYDTTPSYPQITKMNVANKTTADGKLSVEIEVSAAE
jgi:hypothetical protein